jgi:hypothetical protein
MDVKLPLMVFKLVVKVFIFEVKVLFIDDKLPLRLLRFETAQLMVLKFVVKVVKFVFIVFRVDRFVLLSAFNVFMALTILFQDEEVNVSQEATSGKSSKVMFA